jgi:electron transfer flavoprotein beta subunit
MKILVCVKLVPDSEASVSVDSSQTWVRIDHLAPFRLNRYDEYAVEEALLIKTVFPDTTVEAISVGPSQATQAVKRAMGMGADRGIHILAGNGYLSPATIAGWIAAYAKGKGYDLILAGVMAEDDMQGQVGPMVAEMMAIPCATSVVLERIVADQKTLYVEREIEGGFRDLLELSLPAVVTVQTGINKPRYPSLSKVLRAKREKLETIDAETLPQPGLDAEVVRVAYPQKLKEGQVLEGDQQEKAIQLLNILEEKAFLV